VLTNLGGIIPHLLRDISTNRTTDAPTSATHTLRDQLNSENLNFILCHTVAYILAPTRAEKYIQDLKEEV